ncbi:uncharacterized protein LOC100825882 [Brachypodium distachyon]|uniref:BSD domain-containing protein n=1 Tax=Brachypodium distachyon TaxID=15368 RepID=I1J2Y7_BRADI|nr:uncharacterized protein LOC100825882 [Brachypodium distachyon]KQJ85125.1 hypothetical protein BRADI_5g24967v3 [Brachypodium distachyon]|eukprot:XP_003580747.1 uncharacterized protein LOC100825882 [Brachypodium distachyon]
MAFSSFTWPFRRRSSGTGAAAGPSKPPAAAGKGKEKEEEEEAEAHGVTPQLLDFLRTLSPDAFKSSALQLQGASAEAAAAAELTDWQQRHAVLVLAKAKELAKIRYDLCPRHMKDKQFWRVYFLLAKSYILPYELRAIQKEKVRRMEAENRKSKDVITVEVEMQESKCSRESQMLPVDSEFQDS